MAEHAQNRNQITTLNDEWLFLIVIHIPASICLLEYEKKNYSKWIEE